MERREMTRLEQFTVLVERVGFPIVMCVMVSWGWFSSMEAQFQVYRDHLSAIVPIIKDIQDEQRKNAIIQEKLLLRLEMLATKGKP